MSHPTTTNPVTVGPALAQDLPEVHRMLIALAAHHGRAATVTPAMLRRLAMDQGAARLLVARLDDSPARHPVGYAMLRQGGAEGRAGCEIAQVFVQAPFRGRGIGAALIAAARQIARDEGRGQLAIGAHPDGLEAAATGGAPGISAVA